MEKTFNVKGMHCSSCEMLVKDSLDDAGVKVIEISAKKGIVKVEYNERKINDSKIRKIIEGEGYKVT